MWGDQVEVVSPESIREMVELYKSSDFHDDRPRAGTRGGPAFWQEEINASSIGQ
jgi:hypothetical protein